MKKWIKSIILYKNQNIPFLYNVLLCILSGILIFITVNIAPTDFPDTFDYMYYKNISVFSKNFYYASPIVSDGFYFFPRPFTIPLIYKIKVLNENWDYVMHIQKGIHVLSAFLLSLSLCTFVSKKNSKILIISLIYLLFGTWTMVSWTTVILSESLTMSLMFIWIASFLFLLKSRKPYLFALHLLIAILFSFTRDSWPYIILLFYGIWLLLSIIYDKKNLKFILPLFLITGIIFPLQAGMAKAGKRYKTPLINSILYRVLPNDNYTAWFAKEGMPCADDLKKNWEKRPPYDEEWLLYKDPAYNDFINWVETRGKSTYTKFLLTHPRYSIVIPAKEFRKIVTLHDVRYIKYGLSPVGYTNISSWMFPLFPFWLCVGLVITCAFVFFRIERNFIYLLPIVIFLITMANVYLIYNADCFEKERHFFITNILLQIASITALGLLYDRFYKQLKKNFNDRFKNHNRSTAGI